MLSLDCLPARERTFGSLMEPAVRLNRLMVSTTFASIACREKNGGFQYACTPINVKTKRCHVDAAAQ